MGRNATGLKPVYANQERIVNRARDLGLTLGEIERFCGKKPSYLNQLLRGKMQVNAKIERKLMLILQITPEEKPLFFVRRCLVSGGITPEAETPA